eukprot:scaffold4314_cov131-Ochromonas_danica.AAC.1
MSVSFITSSKKALHGMGRRRSYIVLFITIRQYFVPTCAMTNVIQHISPIFSLDLLGQGLD